MRRVLCASLLLVSTVAMAQQEQDQETPPAPQANEAQKKPAAGAAKATSKGEAKDEGHGNLNLTEKPAAEGEYKGVAPGARALPPHPPRLPVRKGPQRMTWPGFQLKDGVPTVFLEVTAVPDYHVDEEPGAVTVTLKNTIVPLKNNRRALDVSGFKTSVQSVEAQSKGRDVRVTIRTKGTEKPAHKERVEDAAGGFHLLVIELPSAAAAQ
jgi:hypothetical protein